MGDDIDKSAEAKKQAKQLDSLTDNRQDDDEGGKNIDSKEVEARLNELRKKKEESDRQRVEREKQLAQVKIKQEDLDLMCTELPLCERAAVERVLREHDGDLVAALKAAVQKFPMIN